MLVEIKRFGKEERAAVTSLDVAKTFGKVMTMYCETSGN